ncbi:MAG: hypothetical protein LAO31_07280 [Acidobacteriia bacterium]|nr:hypothetical protein [Terriglobia bacterium]
MPSVFDKLNFKGQQEILVVNAPPSFERELSRLTGVVIHRVPGALKEVPFSLAFVTRKREVDALAKAVASKTKGDVIVWFAYPKGTSKKYRCDFNRDSGWDALGAAGFEGVRMVAIDEDWSALRFRRTEFIKSIRRDPKRAMSPTGKKRAARR